MDQKLTRALLVEDNQADAFLVLEQLSKPGSRFHVESAEDLSAAMKSWLSVNPMLFFWIWISPTAAAQKPFAK